MLPYERILQFYAYVMPLIGATQFVVLGVWLGLMLLSPATLEGLHEDQIAKLRSYRRRYVRILFRSIFGLIILLPIAGFFIWTASRHITSPAGSYILLGILYGLWWGYLVVGTLTTAWQCLIELQEGKQSE
ncbi:hypothetical protein Pan97_52870 [Bremerella volcania]|uniref:Uncharacterized protein n=1 Tax=Bremerella volcania TaxID=2527984 RepID=A0A518CG39_9BACT|nr:hypothetical protein Pan97_52870 [Bremerella volcania]